MRIVCLINGGDSLVAYHKTKIENPRDEVFPVHFDLNLPNCERAKYLPDYVRVESMRHYSQLYSRCQTYEPLIWAAMMKYRADKIVLGVTYGDMDGMENTLDWANQFNSKIGHEVVSYPLYELGWSKFDVLQNSVRYACAKEAFAALTCHEQKGLYGCGNCYQCMRKRSAILRMNKNCLIPKPSEPNEQIKLLLAEVMESELVGTVSQDALECFHEISPALHEEFGMDSPRLIIRSIKKQKARK